MLAHHGIAAEPADLALPPPGTTRPGCVVVHPGAAHPRRRWPADRFAAVARALRGAGEEVVVTGASAEEALADEVRAGAGLPGTAVLAGRTDVLGLAGLVAEARLVICGDTGVAHLATAFGTPSVVLFGPVSPLEWGPPPGRPAHVTLWRPSAEAPPADGTAGDGTAGDGTAGDALPHPALRAIQAGQVREVAERLLRRTAAQPVAPSMPCLPGTR
jgi:ADP-heptose:LPS heptosyltransferase